MTLKEYALANGFKQAFKPHYEVCYGADQATKGGAEKQRFEQFLESAAKILKVGKVEYFEGQLLTDKKSSVAARERLWWYCEGLSTADYFVS